MSTARNAKPLVVTHIVSGDLWAGAEAQVFQLIRGLKANRRVTPTAVLFNDGILHHKLAALGIDVQIADENSLSPVGQILHIRTHLRKHRTDIVHTHGFKENVLGTLAQHLARVPKSLRTAHGNPEMQVTWRHPRKKVTNILDDAIAKLGQDAVVAVSRQLKTRLSARYPNKTIRISNFIAASETTAASERPSYPRHSYNIILVGRAVPVKRIDLFIDTIALLREKYRIDVRGTVCGDGPLLSRLKEKANATAGPHIEFKGFIGDVTPELNNADILLMPSDHEGLPMTLLEALSFGLPTVAHNVGGIPEVLADGRCGVLVDDHSPEGYAAAVANLINKPDLMADISTAGREHILQEFSDAASIAKYEELYATLSCKDRQPLTVALDQTR